MILRREGANAMPETILRLGPQNAGEQISREEYASADFVPPYRYERVKGRLVVMPPAGPDHRESSRPFQRMLNVYWDAHKDVVDYVDIEGWVYTSDENDRLPDICVYLKASATGQRVPKRVPDLIFEIVSGSREDQERDYVDKRAEYHRVGVKEYVVVDRFKREVLVLTWADDDYEDKWLTAGAVYRSRLLPGLTIPISEAFAEAE
jgi:Uma2 family endonuclease